MQPKIKLIVINLSQDIVVIEDGERAAQMIISSHKKAGWIQVEEFRETSRGAVGFGHTGTK